jgi:anti-anti-sigma regulatory factor
MARTRDAAFDWSIAAPLVSFCASAIGLPASDRPPPFTPARSQPRPTIPTRWLRICRQYAPAGIRLAGEIDYQAEDPLALALAEAIRLDGDVNINMADLTFIDAFCARMVVDAVRSLEPSRMVVMECSPRVAARFSLLGVADISVVSLVIAHDP